MSFEVDPSSWKRISSCAAQGCRWFWSFWKYPCDCSRREFAFAYQFRWAPVWNRSCRKKFANSTSCIRYGWLRCQPQSLLFLYINIITFSVVHSFELILFLFFQLTHNYLWKLCPAFSTDLQLSGSFSLLLASRGFTLDHIVVCYLAFWSQSKYYGFIA